MGKLVRDGLWIWGHPATCFDNYWKHKPRVGEPMETAVGMRDLGARNNFYVPFSNPMNIEEDAKDMDCVIKSGISIEDWGEAGVDRLEKSLSIAKLFPKTTDRLIFDDFFCPGSHCGGWDEYSVADIRAMRERLNKLGYKMWVVLYQWQLEMSAELRNELISQGAKYLESNKFSDARIKEYLDEFDGVSFWFWNEPSVESYLAFTSKFLSLTRGKERLIGCYLWNFGMSIDATPRMVRYQMDSNLALMRAGEIEGVILHNNALGAYDMPGYAEAKAWVAEYGDLEI